MSARVVRAVAGWCLHYPDATLYEHLPLLRDALGELRNPPSGLVSIVDHLGRTSELDAGKHYVDVFDARPRRGLYLTWYAHGDTRLRGAALAELARTYSGAGFHPASGELPDFLPTVLEFVAATGADDLLASHAGALRMLRANLSKVDTPYTGVVDAVLATIRGKPGPDPAPRPVEWVGLEPFGTHAAAPPPPFQEQTR